MTPEQSIQSHMDSRDPGGSGVPHGLDPLAAEDAEDDHERVEEVGEVPARDGREVFRRVVAAVQLHPHHGEYEDSSCLFLFVYLFIYLSNLLVSTTAMTSTQ